MNTKLTIASLALAIASIALTGCENAGAQPKSFDINPKRLVLVERGVIDGLSPYSIVMDKSNGDQWCIIGFPSGAKTSFKLSSTNK